MYDVFSDLPRDLPLTLFLALTLALTSMMGSASSHVICPSNTSMLTTNSTLFMPSFSWGFCGEAWGCAWEQEPTRQTVRHDTVACDGGQSNVRRKGDVDGATDPGAV